MQTDVLHVYTQKNCARLIAEFCALLITDYSVLSFTAQQDFTTSEYAQDAAIGDIDGDGKLDVVIACPNVVNVFINRTSNGIVSFARTDLAGTSDAAGIVVTDFNLDGKPDIAVIGSDSRSAIVYKNNTAGGTVSFGASQSFGTSGSAFSVTAGDIDGDKKPDLAIAGYNSNTFTVLLNTSTTSTISFSSALSQTSQGFRHIVLADFTGDGKNDMVVANINSSQIQLYRNVSSPGAISFAAESNFALGHAPVFLAAGDINGDGKADIVSANVNSSSVSVMVNTSTVTGMNFSAGVTYPCRDGESPYAVAIGDLTADGKPDMVVSNYQSARMTILRNRVNESSNCTGNFKTSVTIIDQPCSGFDNGKATLSATGGNGLIQYSIDGTNYQYGNSFGLPQGSYQVTAKDEGGCTAVVDFLVGRTPGTISISLSDSIIPCGKTAISVTITPTNGVKPYFYRLNEGAYTSSPVLTNLAAGAYKLMVVDSTGCAKEIIFSVRQASTTQLTVTNPAAICTGSTFDLTIPAITAGSDTGLIYTYWLDLLASQPLNSATAIGVAGTYYVKATSVSGCFSIKPVVVAIIDRPVSPTISAGGSTSICQGSSVVLTSSVATNYQWYRNDTIISGATTRSYTALQDGDFKVHTANSCFSSGSNTIRVSLTPRPSILFTGPVAFCFGSSVGLKSSSERGNQWYRNDVILTGSTQQTLTVTDSGSYTVRVTAGACTTDASPAISVSVAPLPAAPAILKTGNSLISSVAIGNQWYKDSIRINGANAQIYIPNAVGVYTAKLISNGCASASSNAISIENLATGNNLDSNIKSGPNPTQTFLEIKYTGASPSYVVQVLDTRGPVLLSIEVFTSTYQLDLKNLRPGYYVLQITTPINGENTQRLILKQ